MADYSHLRKACLPGFARRLEEGWQPHDEDFYDVLQDIAPPLFDATAMEALHGYFWPVGRKRGRPPRVTIDRFELVRRLVATPRRGPAGTIARHLQKRLLSGERRSNLANLTRLKTFQDKQFVRSVIKLFGDEIGQMLTKGPPYLHATLGELDLKPNQLSGSPRARALQATRYVMRTRLGMHAPSIGRMANIASEWSITRWRVPLDAGRLLSQQQET